MENYFFGGNKFHDFEAYEKMTPSNTMVRAVWTKFFTGVARANEIVGGLSTVDESLLSSEVKEAFEAEARFLRGYYYFELVKNFGEVPVFDGVIDATIIDNLRRKPISDVYAFIENDLKFAAERLPETQGGETAYRATKGAALGFLAKAYLYQQKWQEAADASQQVIDLGLYSLETNYADNWNLENEYGVESILSLIHI